MPKTDPSYSINASQLNPILQLFVWCHTYIYIKDAQRGLYTGAAWVPEWFEPHCTVCSHVTKDCDSEILRLQQLHKQRECVWVTTCLSCDWCESCFKFPKDHSVQRCDICCYCSVAIFSVVSLFKLEFTCEKNMFANIFIKLNFLNSAHRR